MEFYRHFNIFLVNEAILDLILLHFDPLGRTTLSTERLKYLDVY